MQPRTILFVGILSLALGLVRPVLADALQQALRERYDSSQLVPSGRTTLASLKSVRVHETLTENLKQGGVTAGFAKTLVELRLRRNGVPVQDGPAATEREGFECPHLSIVVSGVQHESGISAVEVELILWQPVDLLAAENPTFVLTRAWEDSLIGLASTFVVRDTCREAIEQLADRFSNDWLAAHNEKGASPPPTPAAEQSLPPDAVGLYAAGSRVWLAAFKQYGLGLVLSGQLAECGQAELSAAVEPNSQEVLTFMKSELSTMPNRPSGYICMKAEDMATLVGLASLHAFQQSYGGGIRTCKEYLPADYAERLVKRANVFLQKKQESRTQPAVEAPARGDPNETGRPSTPKP